MFPFEKIFFLSEYEVCLYRKDDAVCYSIADAKKLLASLPAGLSAERREIIETACQLVGKVNYFWGVYR